MKFTHFDAYNFNISTILNKSRNNIKVIFIVTYGIILYFGNTPKSFSLVTFDIFLTTSRRIINLVLLYPQYFFFSVYIPLFIF